MGDVTNIEPLRGSFSFSRKVSDGDYGGHEAWASFQFHIDPDDAEATAMAVKDAAFQAKAAVFEQLGIKPHYDSEAGVLREVIEKTFPGTAVESTSGGAEGNVPSSSTGAARSAGGTAGSSSTAATASNGPTCPVEGCGSAMYDNRKRNDEREAKGQRRQPDFRCKRYKDEDGGCAGILWKAK